MLRCDADEMCGKKVGLELFLYQRLLSLCGWRNQQRFFFAPNWNQQNHSAALVEKLNFFVFKSKCCSFVTAITTFCYDSVISFSCHIHVEDDDLPV
jgi:hypothetical protein